MSDLRFLRDPFNWPNYPVCPVKSVTRKEADDSSWPKMGLVVVDSPAVYIKNVFELLSGDLDSQLEGIEKFTYGSFEELIADGWIVD